MNLAPGSLIWSRSIIDGRLQNRVKHRRYPDQIEYCISTLKPSVQVQHVLGDVLSMLRAIVKRLLNKSGWNLYRINPSSSDNCQIVAALNHLDANLVFDIGANTGQFAKGLRDVGYTGWIVSFEPLLREHKTLCGAARSDMKWRVHERSAVGDVDGEIEINVSGNSVSSSILPMLSAHSSAAIGSAYVDKEITPIVRLDSVWSQYRDSGTRFFVKVDAQGFEEKVVDGAENAIEHAAGVLLECSLMPLYEGQRLWRDIIERMESKGFVLWAIQKGFTDKTTGRTLQVNVIFVRDANLNK